MAVKHTFKSYLIDEQYEAEQTMLKEFHEGNYTIENPLVKYNLYMINPLSAVVCFTTEEEVAVSVRVLGKKGPQGDMYHTFPKAKEHVLPIVGLYSNYENKVVLEEYRGKKNTITITTPDVFDGADPIISMHTTPEYLQDNVIMVSPAGEDLTVAYDYNGDARFHMTIPCVFDVKRAKNGNLLMGTNRILRLPYYMSGVYEISPVGKIYKEYRLPGGYHHDEFELPDGNLLVLTDDLQSDTVEDKLALVDRKTGKVLRTYDYRKILPEKECGRSGSWSDEDWFHNNACWYDPNTNSVTLSGRHIDAMINIDFDSGELNWIIGDPHGWPEDFVKKYFFTPVGTNFGWQYEQHACVITPNGDVMCFDNHHYGSKDPEKFLPAKDNYSRGVRYHINTKDMTIEQVWEYGKDRGAEFFSPYICNVEYYNEGHYLVHSGGIGYMPDNVTPCEGLPPAFRNQGGHLYATTVEIDNDVKQLELKVHGNFYRAEKLKLYSDGINLELGKGEELGEMGVTKEFDIEVPAEKTGEILPDKHEGEVIEEPDRFTFNATFEKGQMVQLLLCQGEEIHRYFISTTAMQLKAMCVATFMSPDARQTRTFVNKEGLKGTYDLRVIVDDKEYETGVQVTC